MRAGQSRLSFRHLIRQQDAASNLQCVFKSLQSGASGPSRHVRSSVRRASGDDQVVVADLVIVQLYGSPFEVKAKHVAQQDLDILVPVQDFTDRRSDLGRRQARGCNLVEQRLKGVMILTVDNDELRGQIARASAALKPPNPAPTITICRGAFTFIASH